ncbi:MAG: tRNA pseudouridine(38-40) synthase TruA [Chlamydiales bacterium]|nr:tRNA pseudouridine(38-40) synthase TruA [Chlamydiales bacterium]
MQYKITLSYDGTSYFGWQKTIEGPSIEYLVERALFTIFQRNVSLQVASRTDRGVHAMQQVASFSSDIPIATDDTIYRLNRILPVDIRISGIVQIDDNFHPSTNAKSKTYEYWISNTAFQSPFHRHYYWHISDPLPLPVIEESIQYFIGKKDFGCFCNDPSTRPEDTIREVFDIQLHQSSQNYIIEVTGNRFLYKMVRNIVGTLVYMGQGKLNIPILLEAMEKKDRTKLGITAPAHGLFLKKVNY